MASDNRDPYIRLLVREAVVPLRASASDAAEMVSQLLFGETCLLLEDQKNWSKVQRDQDGYVGWVDTKMLVPIDPPFDPPQNFCFALREIALIQSDGTRLRIPMGTRLPADALHGFFTIAGHSYEVLHHKALQSPALLTQLSDLAGYFLNTPYLWGGVSGWGIDCSGLVQTTAAWCGISLPRDSSQQASVGQEVALGKQQAGDLAFFSKPGKDNITHVGILKDPQTIIHASGRVRIDPFDQNGIIHSDTHQITHHLISMRRC